MPEYIKTNNTPDTYIPYVFKNMNELLLIFLPKTLLGIEFLALVFFYFFNWFIGFSL